MEKKAQRSVKQEKPQFMSPNNELGPEKWQHFITISNLCEQIETFVNDSSARPPLYFPITPFSFRNRSNYAVIFTVHLRLIFYGILLIAYYTRSAYSAYL